MGVLSLESFIYIHHPTNKISRYFDAINRRMDERRPNTTLKLYGHTVILPSVCWPHPWCKVKQLTLARHNADSASSMIFNGVVSVDMRHEGRFFHYESCPWDAWDNIMNRARLGANYQRLMKSELDCDEGIVQVALIEADHLVCYLKKVPAAVLPWWTLCIWFLRFAVKHI